MAQDIEIRLSPPMAESRWSGLNILLDILEAGVGEPGQRGAEIEDLQVIAMMVAKAVREARGD